MGHARGAGLRCLDRREPGRFRKGAEDSPLCTGLTGDPAATLVSDIATVEVACDVNKSADRAARRGARVWTTEGGDPRMVRALDAGLRHFAAIVNRDLGQAVGRAPGAGAAGGLGRRLAGFPGRALKAWH